MRNYDVGNAPWLVNEIPAELLEVGAYKIIVDLVIEKAMWTLEHCFHKFNQRNIQVNFQFISRFPAKYNARSFGKGILTEEGDIYMIFALDMLKSETFDEIEKTAYHETYHVCQMDWLRRHVGPKNFWNVIAFWNQRYPYYNNPLEIGAYNFECNPYSYRQNFAQAFGSVS